MLHLQETTCPICRLHGQVDKFRLATIHSERAESLIRLMFVRVWSLSRFSGGVIQLPRSASSFGQFSSRRAQSDDIGQGVAWQLRSHLFPDLVVHAGAFSALASTSLMPARKLFGPSSSVAFAKASHSPRFPAMETMGVRDPDARIKLVKRSLSFLGTEWHSRRRSKSPD